MKKKPVSFFHFVIRTGIAFLLIVFNSDGDLAAQIMYSGQVTGTDDQPLPGATIAVKGKNLAVNTDISGRFTISIARGDILVVSFVGYVSREIIPDTTTKLLIRMNAAMVNLEEVLVTGYTSQRLKDIAGSVAAVRPRDLTAMPVGTTDNMLQGRAAGLTVITSGEPGAPANIRIHGIGNFGDVTPLYIIDGIQGNINSINPYDIESLIVLKDAAAYSVYGVRGANGVIVVTTKKGKQGRVKISYDMYLGYQFPLAGPDYLDPKETADLYWLAKRNSGDTSAGGNPQSPLYGSGINPVLPDYLFAGNHNNALFEGSPYVADSLYNLNPDLGDIYQIVRFNKGGTDWYHELYKPAFSQNHIVTVSGGGERNQYLVSLGYLDQQGTLINTFLRRLTARVNNEFNFGDHFHFGENMQLSFSENPKPYRHYPGVSLPDDFADALSLGPAQPVYDTHGAWNPLSNNNTATIFDNPVARRTMARDNKARNWQAFGNIYAAIDFLRYFNVKSNFGGTINSFYNQEFRPASNDNQSVKNQLSESSGYYSSWTWTNTLGYNRLIEKHSINALAGIEYIRNDNREVGASVMDLPYSSPDYWLLSNGDPQTQRNYSLAGISTLASFFARGEYNYAGKYYLTATIRRDGSSVFGNENRYGWFPAVGAAWRLTEENFLQKQDWIDELKLRLSWGKTGFYGNTDPFNQFSLYGGNATNAFYDIAANSSGNIQRGFYKVRIGNPKTGWQEDVVSNAGLDAVFWNGRLTVSADIYRKQSKGLLFNLALPDYLGDAIPPNVNIGNISNTGIDLAIGSRGNFSHEIKWDALLTFSKYKSRIEKLNAFTYFDDVFGIVRNQEGHPLSTFFGYRIIGIFKDNADVSNSPIQDAAAPGRFKYADWNSYDASGKLTNKPDGKITDADRMQTGDPNPDFTLGLNIGLNIGSFDISTFFYGSFGNDVFYGVKVFRELSPMSELGAASRATLYNSWLPSRQQTGVPVAETQLNFSNNGTIHSYAVVNGTYFRNKSLMIGYSFRQKGSSGFKTEKLRVYLQVTNLFTITNYAGMDPEVYKTSVSPLSPEARNSSFGIDFGTYPTNQKQILIGLNLGF